MRYVLFLIICFFSSFVYAQDSIHIEEIDSSLEFKTHNFKLDSLNKKKPHPYRNNLNIELGGTGLLYSLSYERNFLIKPMLYQSIKVGLSVPFLYTNQIFVPIDYSLYLGKGRTKLLLGAGFIGLIGTNPSPKGLSAQKDYLKIYQQNQYAAISKYGTDYYEKSFDLAYTAKIGFKHIGKRIDFYAYYNCFYIRFSTAYHFQPVWLGTGINYKFGK